MGIMQNGNWVPQDFAKRNKKGAYVRADTQYRRFVTADGSSAFPAEAGRYHLMVAHACPWAYRTMTFRALKGLEQAISVAYVKPLMLENGWEFYDGADPVTGAAHFDVPEREAARLVGEAATRLPGYLLPRLVRETAGAPSKSPVAIDSGHVTREAEGPAAPL